MLVDLTEVLSDMEASPLQVAPSSPSSSLAAPLGRPSSPHPHPQCHCYLTRFSYTHSIEAVSCDEMLVELTEVLSDTGGRGGRHRCKLLPPSPPSQPSPSPSIYCDPTHFSYTHSIEAVSCDEMLVDLTEVLSDTGASPLQVARVIREEIKLKTSCNASAGLGELHIMLP